MGRNSVIDVVLSPHVNPFTCGTAKWNLQLAKHLGVPCLPLGSEDAPQYEHPLISARLTEMPALRVVGNLPTATFDLLVHDYAPGFEDIIRHAGAVYAANPVLTYKLLLMRHDVQTLFCPSSLEGRPERNGLRVLTYGMAHKIQTPHYERLKGLLDAHLTDYSVNLSCAVHEGSPWEDTVGETWSRIEGVFGDHARLLGYVADDAFLRELAHASAVAIFFSPAARANNTSLWAALEHGVPVITNLDQDSPPELQHEVNVFDIAQLTAWPLAHELRRVRYGAAQVAKLYSWANLIQLLQPQTVTA